MKRLTTMPRENWKTALEENGFLYHTLDSTYWVEGAYYSFTMEQVLVLEEATQVLYELCLAAVEHVIENKRYAEFQIPEFIIPWIEKSWEEEWPSVYGRFDFFYDGSGIPKMLEFNADTPTSLFESSVVQWFWAQEFGKADQFNSIHEKLIEYWKDAKNYLKPGKLYFTCVKDNIEDFTTVQYLKDTAIQAGIDSEFIYIDDIGFQHQGKYFCDEHNQKISNIFKLYPWEWIIHEPFAGFLPVSDTYWIEPPWKMILSNKMILVILYELFPNCPYLLAAWKDQPVGLQSYVKKPLLSREGANVEMVENLLTKAKTDGEYGEEGYIYQALAKIPNFKGNFSIVGSWVIAGESAGISIRESDTPITDNNSRFVAHVIYD